MKVHSNDVTAYIEKCKFVENAFYEEDYNPKKEVLDHCLEELKELFPSNPIALIYRSSFLYGDSAIVFLKNLLKLKEEHSELWADSLLWQVHNDLAEQYRYSDEHTRPSITQRKQRS